MPAYCYRHMRPKLECGCDGTGWLQPAVNTVPEWAQRGMERVARTHGCSTTSELYASPTLNHDSGFDPRRAERN